MLNVKRIIIAICASLSINYSSITMDNNDFDIVVVGGGLAGLNACRTILKAHPEARIALCEGRDRLGGRTRTITLPSGKLVEAGGEFIDRDQIYIQNVLAELGVDKEPVRLDGDICCIHQDKKMQLDHIEPYLNSVLDKLKTIQKSLAGNDHGYFNTKPSPWTYAALSDHLSHLSDDEATFLQCIIRDECGIDLKDTPVTSLNFIIEKLDDYKTLVQAKTTPLIGLITNFALGFIDYQYRIKGGTRTLVEALERKISPGTIFKETCLQRLTRQNNRYTLQMANGRSFQARKVILAMPFSVLRSQYNILDDVSLGICPQLRQQIDTLSYGTNSKLIVPISKFMPTSYVLDMRDGGITGWQNPGGMTWMLGGTVGAELTDNSPQVKILSDQMRTLFKGDHTDSDKPLIINWSLDPFSRGSYTTTKAHTPLITMPNNPNIMPELSNFAMPLNNNTLFFIGEHTCSGGVKVAENGNEPISSGYMQSALFSGYVVGKFICENYNINGK
jgi:predicted NAD/FAD-dependent oxidoreductase